MSSEYTSWMDTGEKIGLSGDSLRKFIQEQQALQRDERSIERERERELAERERELAEREQVRELADRDFELKKIQLESVEREKEADRKFTLEKLRFEHESHLESTRLDINGSKVNAPRLPNLNDKDNVDAYLNRFERYATNHHWDRGEWCENLSNLLTGKALEVYYRLAPGETTNYMALRTALLRRFDYTTDGFLQKFRQSPVEDGESPVEYLIRLGNYVDKWIELSDLQKNYQSLKDLMVREQLLNVCDRDLALYLTRETDVKLETVGRKAISFLCSVKRKFKVHVKSSVDGKVSTPRTEPLQCHHCSGYGHKRPDCPKLNHNKSKGFSKPNNYGSSARGSEYVNTSRTLRCFLCDTPGHKALDCKKFNKSAALIQVGNKSVDTNTNIACFCMGDHCMADDCESVITPVATGTIDKTSDELPTAEGMVGDHKVLMLRDSGCTGVVVKHDLVSKDQFTGEITKCRMIDKTILHIPTAMVTVNTPYYQGTVKAMCLKTPIYDLVIGNIPGVRQAYDPDVTWKSPVMPKIGTETGCPEVAVITRSQALKGEKVNKPLIVAKGDKMEVPITVDVLQKLQESDESIISIPLNKERLGKRYITWYEKSRGLVYKVAKSRANDKVSKQMVVPTKLRKQVMAVAHESVFAGHLGIKKTVNRIKTCFIWPGIDGQVSRFCQSCDVCQRTIDKGKVVKVPLGTMPVIETPFSRMGMDLVGPIFPMSDRGHRYILCMVDYATRYPEAVALKHITTEDVAEAMLSVFSRVGIPEEILSDLGTQFTSDLMKEVSRLLSIKQLHSTPYHPICNGLTEKMNGTLKKMLKRLTAEKPKDWDRYLDALLFAYREVPSETMGFSPFELIYGRSVRGPMHILKECWTNTKTSDDDVTKNSYEYVLDLQNRLAETCQLAQEELRQSQSRYKKYYDRKARNQSYKVGDEVLILLPTDHNKLLLQWKGPFRVVKRVAPYDYTLDINGKVKTFHINMLKRYFTRKVEAEESLRTAAVTIIEPEVHDGEDEDELYCDFVPEAGDQRVIGKTLSPEQKTELVNLLDSFQQLFSDKPGEATLIEHKIELNTDVPVRTKMYPLPYTARNDIKDELQSMLELGVIETSESPYASPVVLVRKKDGTNRFCIDYRKLNKVTLFDPEPMPKPDDIYTKLKGDRYFTKIDLCKGYWQVIVRAEDRPKTAFITPDNGVYQFRRMPFGLMNSPATFNRLMRKLLKGMDHIDSYIDDVLIHTKTWSDHIRILGEFLARLQHANLTVKATKCVFAVPALEYVGHVVSGKSVGVLDGNIEKIKDAQRPTTKKMVRSFNGLMGYYRNHIPNFAHIVYPLTELTRKCKPNKVEWNAEHEHAFNTLKQKLVSKPILRIPDFDKQFVVQTDASGYGLGVALMQYYGSELLPVAYASRKLLPREQVYATIEKECLAIVYAIKRFKEYLYGKEFVIQTDHKPLIYINHNRSNNDRIMRWSLLLQPYKFRIESIPGQENALADFLSRNHE